MHAPGRTAIAACLFLSWACTGSIAGRDGVGGAPRETDAAGEPVRPGAPASGDGKTVAPGASVPKDVVGSPFHVARTGLARLTRAELDATLRDLLFEEARPAATKLPEENLNHFYVFDNEAAANRELSAALVEGVEGILGEAVRLALRDEAKRAKLVPCTPSGPGDAACMSKFVAEFGRLALRGPLDADEQKRYEAFVRFGMEAGDFWKGVEGAMRAILMSPRFLYRIELGEPVKGSPGLYELTGYEMASRLSFALLGTTPDRALLDAAGRGALDTPTGVRTVAERLLTDPRARRRVHHFFAYWMGYADGLPGELAPHFLEETNTLIDDVVFERRADLRELFLAERTFIGDKLRKHYADLKAAANGKSGWVPYGASGRRGILSHGSVLASFKTGDDTSPTKRGRFVRMRLLCDVIPDPPPDVAVDVAAAPTQCKTGPEGFYTRSHQGAACKGCHDQMDPIGFGLERYDVKGQLRANDDGKPQCAIDGKGTVLTDVAGASKVMDFNGPGQLAQVLVETGKVDRCAVQHLYRFAQGRMEDADDGPSIDWFHQRFQASGRNLAALFLEIVSHPAFRHRRGEI